MIDEDLAAMRAAGLDLDVVTQDNRTFPEGLSPRLDESLLESHRLGIEIVPTVVAYNRHGQETGRVFGWNTAEWRALSGVDGLGEGLRTEARLTALRNSNRSATPRAR